MRASRCSLLRSRSIDRRFATPTRHQLASVVGGAASRKRSDVGRRGVVRHSRRSGPGRPVGARCRGRALARCSQLARAAVRRAAAQRRARVTHSHDTGRQPTGRPRLDQAGRHAKPGRHRAAWAVECRGDRRLRPGRARSGAASCRRPRLHEETAGHPLHTRLVLEHATWQQLASTTAPLAVPRSLAETVPAVSAGTRRCRGHRCPRRTHLPDHGSGCQSGGRYARCRRRGRGGWLVGGADRSGGPGGRRFRIRIGKRRARGCGSDAATGRPPGRAGGCAGRRRTAPPGSRRRGSGRRVCRRSGTVSGTAGSGWRYGSGILTVVLLAFVLLTVAFRSIVIATKAAILNLLSVAAAYGVVVVIFQWGWGSSVINIHEKPSHPGLRSHADVRHRVRTLDGL